MENKQFLFVTQSLPTTKTKTHKQPSSPLDVVKIVCEIIILRGVATLSDFSRPVFLGLDCAKFELRAVCKHTRGDSPTKENSS